MPFTVVLFRETDGTTPFLQWLDRLPEKARVACLARIAFLRERGHLLRRPHADYLRDGIYELRAKVHGVNYRMLYFFHGQQVVVLSHGLAKQAASIPLTEITLALRRKSAFESDPRSHSYERP